MTRTILPIKQGGTGATAAAQARTNLATVGLVGDESIAGIKTFGSFLLTPSSAPTTDYQAANKKYVDDRNERLDGGASATVYLAAQSVDGGSA